MIVSEGGDLGEIVILGMILFYYNKNIFVMFLVLLICLLYVFMVGIFEVKFCVFGWEFLGIVLWFWFLIEFVG